MLLNSWAVQALWWSLEMSLPSALPVPFRLGGADTGFLFIASESLLLSYCDCVSLGTAKLVCLAPRHTVHREEQEILSELWGLMMWVLKGISAHTDVILPPVYVLNTPFLAFYQMFSSGPGFCTFWCTSPTSPSRSLSLFYNTFLSGQRCTMPAMTAYC